MASYDTDYDTDDRLCVKCGEPSTKGNILSQVGAPKGKRKGVENDPLEKLIEQSQKLKLEELTKILRNNKATQKPTYIHSSCRTYMNNKTRTKRTSDVQDVISAKRSTPEYVSSSTRSTKGDFDFKKQCFYCTKLCEYDDKHPERNTFEYVRTMDSGILKTTLAICQQRNDTFSKLVEMRLLSVSDLVAAEAMYHKSCRSRFENPPSSYLTPGRPTSEGKMKTFLAMCEKFEDDMEVYTLLEFHESMSMLGTEIYSMKMTKEKLKEKYGASIRFVQRGNRSDIILLENIRFFFIF